MALSTAVLAVQNLLSSVYGYISGSDLGGWCDPQLLITVEAKVPTTLRRSVNQAISEVQSALLNRYDLTAELLKTDIVSPMVSTVLTGGIVSGTNILLPGAGLTIAPAVTVVNDPSDTTGNGAAITATISQGQVSNINLLTPGYGFKQPPTVTITGGGGTGATAIAVLTVPLLVSTVGPVGSVGHLDALTSLGTLGTTDALDITDTLDGVGRTGTLGTLSTIDSIQITNGGTGYTTPPTITIQSVDGFGGGANAIASINSGKLISLNITSGGTLYTAPPTLSFDLSKQLPDSRNAKLVKIITLYAIRNAMGQSQSVGETMQNTFNMVDDMVRDLKMGAASLPIYAAPNQLRAAIEIVQDRFHTLG